jgi:hypothetical protein
MGPETYHLPHYISPPLSLPDMIIWGFVPTPIMSMESTATLPPFGSIEGHKWFFQISSQWESQKNRFAFISFGKIQFFTTLHYHRSCRTASETQNSKNSWLRFQAKEKINSSKNLLLLMKIPVIANEVFFKKRHKSWFSELCCIHKVIFKKTYYEQDG